MMKTKLVLTGATGLLGRYLVQPLELIGSLYLLGFSNKIESSNFMSVDLTKKKQTFEYLNSVCPNCIIHTVALTDMDKCEDDSLQAYKMNVQTTKHIVEWIEKLSSETKLIFISTDQLYDGPEQHSEDNTRPSSVYSLTKLWAEDLTRQVSNYLILRTNFYAIGQPGRKSFVDWLVQRLVEKCPIFLFDDVFFNPLYVKDLSSILLWLIEHDISGTYNVGAGGEGMSKAQFALLLAEVFHKKYENVSIGSVDTAGLKAYRSKNMRMSVKKLEGIMNKTSPTIKEGLEKLYTDWCSQQEIMKNLSK